jgi:hypothetical protein
MKKTLISILIVVAALAVFTTSAVFAQGQQPPAQPGAGRGMPLAPDASAGVGGGYGLVHDYVEKALATKLGLTEKQVEDQLAAGKTMAQIALDNGILQENLPAFMNEVHSAAFDKVVADGVITREQADLMLQRMATMQQYNLGTGNCPRSNGQTGQGIGPGRMNGRGMVGGFQRTTNP